jgi:FkbM family methyltransferase
MIRHSLILGLGAVTRDFHPRGTDRLLRRLHNPDRRVWSVCARIEIKRYRQRFYVDTASFLEWTLFFYGTYEEPVLRLIEASLRPGECAIDVGANIGIHSVVMAKCVGSSGRVLSLEPNPRVAKRLRQNLDLNGLDQVDVYDFAASDRAGTAILRAPPGDDANQGTATLGPGNGESIRVTTRKLDDLTNRFAIKLVKIDAEGWEYPVLRGAERLLREGHPRLLFEFSPETWASAGWAWQDCLTYLRGLGYKQWSTVTRHGLERLDGQPSGFVMVVADHGSEPL